MVVEDVLADKYPIDSRGRMGTITEGFLRGWYFNPESPTDRPTMELVADDKVVGVTIANVFRRDLLTNHIGDGAHGFVFRLPAELYDGQPHHVGVRVSGSPAYLRRPMTDLVLGVDELPDFRAQVTSIDRGVVTGYCYNANAPADVLTVVVLRNEEPVRRISANAGGAGIDEATGHGFSFAIGEAGADLLNDSIRFEIMETGETLDVGTEHLGRASVWIEVAHVNRHMIEGAIVLPGTLNPDYMLELFRDGEIVDVLTGHAAEAGLTRYPFVVPLDEGKKHWSTVLTVAEAGTARALGQPVTVALPLSDNLVANGFFRDWEANRPTAWQLSDQIAAIILPGEGVGGSGIRFNCTEIGELSQIELLSQPFSLNLIDPSSRRLDLLVDQHASDVTVLEMSVRLRRRDGETHTLSVDVSAPAGWSSRSARVILPVAAGEFEPEAQLVLTLIGAIPASYGLTLVGVGTPGFSLGEAGDAIPAWAAVNAIRHGNFANWSGPFRQSGSARQIRFSEGWMYTARGLNPRLEFWLDRVEARDPAKGIGARDVYALSIRGPVETGSARVDAELDAAAMFRRAPNELSFYASSRKGGQIYQILVFSRQTNPSDPGRTQDTRIAAIARRVDLTVAGRFETRMIPAETGLAIQTAAREAIGDPNTSLFIGFEFIGSADCTITELALTRKLDTQATVAPGFVGFEDPRITQQLAKLKMVTSWVSPEAVEPPSAGGPAPRAPIKWARPARNAPSVDIVVCVYNAHDEVYACLTSIVEVTTIPYTLTIIDDGSELLTSAMLDRFVEGRPWVRLKRNLNNLGYTRSANIGMAGSDAAWVVLLNSDTIVTPGWLEGMLDCALSDPKIALVGPVSNAATWQSVPDVRDSRGGWKVNTLPAGFTAADMAVLVSRHSARERPEVPLLNGFCTLMKTAVLEEIGYLDERSFPTGYGEESDLCVRVGEAGYKLVIADDVYIYHSKSASFGSERRRELSKAGNAALLAKHPDVDFQELQNEMGESDPMIRLRKALRHVIETM